MGLGLGAVGSGPDDPPLPPGLSDRLPSRRRGRPARQARSSASRTSRRACRSCSTRRGSATSSAATSPSCAPAAGARSVERALGRADRHRERARGAARRARRAAAVRAARAAGDRRLEGRVDLRDLLDATRSTPTRRRTSTTRSRSGARPTASAPGCTSPTSRASSPPGRRSTTARRERAFSTYVPGRVAPMLPHELADDLCSLRPHQDRLCVTVEMPPGGEPQLLPLGDPLGRAAHLRAGASGARRRPTILEALELNDELAHGAARRRASRAARCRCRRPRSPSASTATAASPTRGARASRTRTCSSRS